VTAPSLGLVLECGPQGADKQVCEYLIERIRPGMRVRSETLDNKANLLRDSGKVAARLLKDGCACVLIVWDLRPAWPDRTDKPCRHTERRELLRRMAEAGVPEDAPVYLVCVEQELESWLLANERALSAILSTPAHPFPVPRVRHPDRRPQPKAEVIGLFRQARGWRYNDNVHAIRVLKAVQLDLGRLRCSESFFRFEEMVSACCGR
jgi:hypothetical protein